MKRCPQCGKEYADNVRFCTTDGEGLEAAGGQSSLPKVKAVESKGPQTDPMIGRVIAGRYSLLEKLGQGGMGAVYKGQHIRMQRLTAIKILTSELVNNEEFIARFQREAEMASQIDHPNAVSIYDFGEAEDGLIYLAMEFVDGKPLSDLMKREGPLPLDRVVRITKQAADALGAAHALGIIHRDFKPDNIMVGDKPGRPDWVEVVDFGIAKRAVADSQQPGLTQVGFVLGTPLYMSPEQVAGEDLDQRSDLYSLALVVYEMLSGALPFDGATTQSKMVKRLLEPPRLISRISPQVNVSPAVEAVILRALSRAPSDRYSSTMEFAQAFESAARPEPFTQAQHGLTHPHQDVTRHSPNTPVDTNPRPVVNPNRPPHPVIAPPYVGPNAPDYNAAYRGQPYPAQPSSMPHNPAYPQHAQTPFPFQPPPPKSHKGRNALLIIAAIILSLLGGCVVIVGIIATNAKRQANRNYLQTNTGSGTLGNSNQARTNSNQARADTPLVATETIKAAAYEQVQPVYPPAARRAGITGLVKVQVYVTETGYLQSVDAWEGPQILRDAAAEAVRQWKFNPVKIDGVPRTVRGMLFFRFGGD